MTTTLDLNPTQAGAQITRDNYHWGTTLGAAAGPISFGFRQSAPTYNNADDNEQGTFAQVTAVEMTATENALRLWSNLANIKFTEVNAGGYTNSATILVGNYHSATDNSEAFAFNPTSNNQSFSSAQGDVWLNTDGGAFTTVAPGSYEFESLMHELGHTLGLEHPGDYNAGPGITLSYAANAAYIEDSRQYSIMSYFDASNTGANHVYQGKTIYASTPLLDDITAIQRLYGLNTTFDSGDNTYGFHNTADPAYAITSGTQQVVFCIWDTGGNDTLDCSGYANNQNINLTPGSFSDVGALTKNVSIALGAIIENATGGSGNDTIVGNIAINKLFGGAGNDTITGGGGNDIIDGGSGANTAVYSGAAKGYKISVGSSIAVQDLVGSDGVDTLTNIQNLQFTDQTVDTSWFTKTASLAGSQIVDLVELYIASFNRAPDALGLDYWGSRLHDGMSLSDIAKSFFVQPETIAAYPAGQSTQTFVTKVYNNVLGRGPDTAGLNYWLGELANGDVSKDAFLLAIINGARASTGSAADATYLANKELVGAHYALTDGLSDLNWAKTVMSTVNGTSASVTTSNLAADAFLTTASTPASAELVVQLVGLAA